MKQKNRNEIGVNYDSSNCSETTNTYKEQVNIQIMDERWIKLCRDFDSFFLNDDGQFARRTIIKAIE